MALAPLQLGNINLDPVLVLLGLLGFAVLALLVLVVIVAVHMGRRRQDARESDAQLSELKVRLQTLAEIAGSGRNSTTIFPIPIDLIRPFYEQLIKREGGA